ncbi:MAG: hypothetical protein QOH08_881 [Chloroflexota bacterium]|nr:hypothetical protein [Chloroflexota bacterium]
MKLVKFVCVSTAHAAGRSESALTIHQGAWAFCASGGDGTGHEWRPSDGLPLAEAMRFTPSHQAAPAGPPDGPGAAKAATPTASKGKTRTR